MSKSNSAPYEGNKTFIKLKMFKFILSDCKRFKYKMVGQELALNNTSAV
jgi:hypothetical protein